MTLLTPISPPRAQRARGRLAISAGYARPRGSHLKILGQEGSFRAIFPRPQAGNLEAVIINTAGGITGGDQFFTSITTEEGARISVTTQAAERIYRASGPQAGQMHTAITVAKDAQTYWLPQETILFQGSHLNRRLDVNVDPSATCLMVEPLVFGRAASGETLTDCTLHDTVTITSGGRPVYFDSVQMQGDLAAQLALAAVSNSARAMASVVFVNPMAKDHLAAVRALLSPTAGATLLSDTALIVRCLAQDSYELRRALLPVLTLLTNNTVPKNWRL